MMTFSEALTVVEGRKDFAITKHYGTITINYLLRLPDTFDGIRVNFRGITFDEKTGNLLSLPFHKFHNINENEETQWDKLKDLTATIYEKIDGSLIHWLKHPSVGLVKEDGNPVGIGVVASTRMRSCTTQAQSAFDFASKNPPLMEAIVKSVESGYTPLFEYASPSDPIVIAHPKPRLVYLMSRNRTTGEYVREHSLLEFDHAESYNFPFSEVLDRLKTIKDFEGYVCHLSNGMIVKAKSDWYLERHRIVDMMMRPVWRVWESVYNDTIDDTIALAADIYKPLLKKVWAEAQERLLLEEERTKFAFNCSVLASRNIEDPREKRKKFVEEAKKWKGAFSSAMLMYDGKDVRQSLQRKILEEVSKTHTKRLLEHFEGEI